MAFNPVQTKINRLQTTESTNLWILYFLFEFFFRREIWIFSKFACLFFVLCSFCMHCFLLSFLENLCMLYLYICLERWLLFSVLYFFRFEYLDFIFKKRREIFIVKVWWLKRITYLNTSWNSRSNLTQEYYTQLEYTVDTWICVWYILYVDNCYNIICLLVWNTDTELFT